MPQKPPQPKTPGSAAVTAMRRQLVASLRLQGLTPHEICAKLDEVEFVNPENGQSWAESTILNDIKGLTADWQKASRVATQEHIAETLAKLKEVERDAWTRHDLDSVLKAVDKEMKLLGLSAPQTISITTQDRAKELAALAGTTPEEIMRIARELAANGSGS